MSAATVDYEAMAAYVARVKAAWREAERNKTWEEKIASIERMRERDQALKRAREKREGLAPMRLCE
jgi:hypothetical protein